MSENDSVILEKDEFEAFFELVKAAVKMLEHYEEEDVDEHGDEHDSE